MTIEPKTAALERCTTRPPGHVVRRIACCLLACAAVACAPKPAEDLVYGRVLRFAAQPARAIFGCVASVEILPLEFSESAAFRNCDKLVFRNGLIYIGDFTSRKIVAYDMSGRIAFVVDRHGRGHGEYLELKSFAVDDRCIYTLDNYAGKVNCYDCRTGEFRVAKELPFVAWDVEVLGNGDFIFAYVPLSVGRLKKSQPRSLLFITDGDCRVKRRLFDYGDSYSEPFGRQVYFTTAGDSLVFSSFRFDGYTVFDRYDAGEFHHTSVDFARKAPDGIRLDKDALSRSACPYLVATPVLCKGYVAVDVSCGEYLENYLYDPHSDAFVGNSATDCRNLLLPPMAVYEDKFVSLLPVESYDELVGNGFRAAARDVERRLRESDIGLVFYTMK